MAARASRLVIPTKREGGEGERRGEEISNTASREIGNTLLLPYLANNSLPSSLRY